MIPAPPQEEKIWDSCCFRVSKMAVAYIGQMLVVVMVLSICTYFLIEAQGSCDRSSPYISLISFILGKVLSQVVTSK
jgi:hypothetical protein